MNPVTKTFQYGGQTVSLETGRIARQATGAVLVTVENTSVLCTVVAEKQQQPGKDFFPLAVHYQEKTYSVGKIPGGFFKREGRPSEKETLTSRLIDRPIRPLFHKDFKHEPQIIFTVLLLYLFQFRNFAVGTTYSKTEVFQVAILGFLILGDTVTTTAAAAIAAAGVGVVVLSAGQSKVSLTTLIAGVTEKPTLIGLVCGAFLGASVVFFRGAALSLNWDDLAMTVAYTLAVALVIQTIAMGAYLAWKEASTLKAVFVHWRWSIAVGAVGMAGSVAWFLAFTMQNAAYVRALGQIELVFTFVASIFFFKEKDILRWVLSLSCITFVELRSCNKLTFATFCCTNNLANFPHFSPFTQRT